MFDTINVHFEKSSTSLGELAESLLFYDHVNLVVKIEDLAFLLAKVGIDNIIELGNRGLRLVAPQQVLGILSINGGYQIISAQLENEEMSHRFLAKSISECHSGSCGINVEKNIESLRAISIQKRIDPTDPMDMMNTIASPFLKRYLDNFFEVHKIDGKGLRYQFYLENSCLLLDTNLESKEFYQIDLRTLLNPETILLNIASALSDLKYGAQQNASMMLSPSASFVAALKVRDVLDSFNQESQKIKLIQQIANPHYYSISDVINSGQRSFTDFIKLLDKSAQFKEWKQSISDEKSFIEEYSAAVEKENKWINDSRLKVGRWIITSMVGFTSSFMGLAVSGIDSFFLDKLLHNWSPNQFLKDEVRPFLT